MCQQIQTSALDDPDVRTALRTPPLVSGIIMERERKKRDNVGQY